MSDNTQTVVENSDGQATPAAEGQDAPDSLDAALAEFEASSEPEPEQTTSAPADVDPKALDDIRRDIATLKEDTARRRTDGDVAEAVKSLQRGLENLHLPDATVNRMLHGYASTDGRFLKAFQARQSNPTAWKRVLDNVSTEIRGEFESRPDANLTADREAVNAAVRNASTTSPESGANNKDLSAMTDAEFEAHKKALG
tara:strand:- start:1708 stop:2304 length:597 start_codon:yes stop_codon:yes gene_type:complete